MSTILALTEMSMLGDVRRLDMISHNLANAMTPGFKREIPVGQTFDALFTQAMSGSSVRDAQAQVLDRAIDRSAGAFSFTGNALDLAVEGGYLEVQGPSGPLYTRQGRLSLDPAGRLSLSDGMLVNGTSGDIRLTGGNPYIDKDGRIFEGDDFVAQLKIVSFGEEHALKKELPGLYSISGQVNPEAMSSVRQGYLEGSNVDSMHEMVNMISLMRHFETSQKVASAYDDMIGDAVRTITELS